MVPGNSLGTILFQLNVTNVGRGTATGLTFRFPAADPISLNVISIQKDKNKQAVSEEDLDVEENRYVLVVMGIQSSPSAVLGQVSGSFSVESSQTKTMVRFL